MYITASSPTRSIRSHPFRDSELVLVGGESHRTGESDPRERYRKLEEFARERFQVESVQYRWATQDNMPVDGVPYVGRLWPLSDRLLTATGFKKWGLAQGVAAAMMIVDAIEGRSNPWASLFSSTRVKPLAGGPKLVEENANVARHFFLDRVTRRGSARELARGDGKVVGAGLRQVAVHRDDAGELHAVSARCTHLGCIVSWNGGERTWDCPCHGSRFAIDGAVLQGPAVAPLERVAFDGG
jgi:Rieske Fe-S protein